MKEVDLLKEQFAKFENSFTLQDIAELMFENIHLKAELKGIRETFIKLISASSEKSEEEISSEIDKHTDEEFRRLFEKMIERFDLE